MGGAISANGIHRTMAWMVLLSAAAGLAACRSGLPKEVRDQADPSVTFESVFPDPDSHKGKTVLWGGVIIETRNTGGGAVIELIHFPLDAGDRPRTDQPPGGRFLVSKEGFLDPAVYAAGREVTVLGDIAGLKVKLLDEIEYRYPLLKGREIHLWGPRRAGPQFHIGFGATIVR